MLTTTIIFRIIIIIIIIVSMSIDSVSLISHIFSVCLTHKVY
jgi:hypothetical protein